MGDILDLPVEKRGARPLVGTIKWWNEIQRMGFVSVDENEYYINEKAPEIAQKLKEGLKIRFIPYETLRGLEARQIEII